MPPQSFLRLGAILPAFVASLLVTASHAAPAGRQAPWQADLGDGTYQNPILHADYSDPDAIRVGDDYWMTASSFSHVPGLPILHSRDLVNWTLVAHALPRLAPAEVFQRPQHGKGVWAPALRHHAGRFYLYFPDPDFGISLVTASDPRGPWSEPVLVKGGRGLIDPCPLWDDDGRVYLIHGWAASRARVANVLTLLELNADGTQVIDDFGYVINGNKLPGYGTLEGPKLYKRDGWYYIFAPAGGVATGWQSVFRAKTLRGPYEDRIVLEQGATAINGPHQGAWVDTPSGESWFLHFQDKGAYGRVVHLQPMRWQDGWPLMGTGAETGRTRGEPVTTHAKPSGPSSRIETPDTSDTFALPTLGLQWQWQANPEPHWATLTDHPGFLRLHGQPEPRPHSLYDSPALLLQKFPAPEFSVTTEISLVDGPEDGRAGLIVFGYDYAALTLRRVAGRSHVEYAVNREANKTESVEVCSESVSSATSAFFRVEVREGGICQFSYSPDGKAFTPVGVPFTATVARWVGAKVGLFATGQVSADFASFEVTPRVPQNTK